MDTSDESTLAGERPRGSGGAMRPGQSGEGSRSALEELIQQERRRDAQRPREAEGSGDPAAA